MSRDIKAGDLVFIREWPDEKGGDWIVSDHPPLLVIEEVESKQLTMFGGKPHIESLKVMDSSGMVWTMPAGYFMTAEARDAMIQELQRVCKR